MYQSMHPSIRLIVGLTTDLLHSWVFNSALPAADQTGHAIYNPSDSESFQNLTDAWFDVSYGDNSSTSGLVGKETVHIGAITVVGQAIELPSIVSPQFSGDRNSDGIVGLGFSQSGNSIRPSPMPTFFENAAPKLKDHVFTANLKLGTPGHYQFGTIDASACKALFWNDFLLKIQTSFPLRTQCMGKFTLTTLQLFKCVSLFNPLSINGNANPEIYQTWLPLPTPQSTAPEAFGNSISASTLLLATRTEAL